MEHLHKPSIKPSPESESIFIPVKPDPEVTPMEVDVKFVSEDSGTEVPDSGTPEPMQEDPNPEDPMDIEEPIPLRVIRAAPKWAQGIMSYMEDGELPDEIPF